VERVREDLRDPDETRLHVAQEEQVDRAEQQSADTDDQPHDADLLDGIDRRRDRRQQAKQRRRGPQHQR